MFERFTERARQVVVAGQDEARALGATHIDTEHLLLAMMGDDESLGTRVLHRMGVEAPAVRTAVQAFAEADADALSALGIDLDAVRAKVEERFGPGALDRRPRRDRRWWRGGRGGGHIPFSARAKKALEMALREGLLLQHNYIGTEHLLLGLLHDEHSAASAVLRSLGVPVDLDRLRTYVLEELGRAA